VIRLIESGDLIPYMLFSIPIIAIVAHSVTKVLRMRHEERMARGSISGEDAAQWQRTVDRLETRMKALEAILDDQAPGWRRKFDD
jgi:phage shock protein B